MAEAQYRFNQDKGGSGLAGTIKLGGLYHFGKFYDQLFDVDGQPLALPSSSGIAKTYRGNYSFYGVIDQMLWRLPGDDPKKGVGAFARVAISPADWSTFMPMQASILWDFGTSAGRQFRDRCILYASLSQCPATRC
jgi:carbohydrate-selective porin OprB